jgi:hypothetical protein
MNDTVNFDSIGLPIPDLILKYPTEQQKYIFNYLKQLNDIEKTAYIIAKEHLGTSFNISKSNGFKQWKKLNIIE